MAIWNTVSNPTLWGAMALTRATQFPWLSDNQASWIFNKTLNVPEKDREQVQYNLYKQVLPVAMANKKEQERIQAKKELAYQANVEKDKNKQWQLNLNLKLADLADTMRKDALNKGYDASNANDEELIKPLVAKVPNGNQLLADYINGKSEEFLVSAGLKQAPVIEERSRLNQAARNVIGGIGKATRTVAESPLMASISWAQEPYQKLLDSWALTPEQEAKVTAHIAKLESAKIGIAEQSNVWIEADTSSIWYNVANVWTQIAMAAPLLIEWGSMIKSNIKSAKLQKTADLNTKLSTVSKWEDILADKELTRIYDYTQPWGNKPLKVWAKTTGKLVAPTTTQPTRTMPTSSDINTMKTAVKYDAIKSNPEEWVVAADKAIVDLAKKTEALAKKDGTAFNKNQLKKKLWFDQIPESPKAIWDYKRGDIEDVFYSYMDKNPKTRAGLLEARKQFYQDPRVKTQLEWKPSSTRQFITDMWDKVNEFVAMWNKDITSLLAEQKHLFSLKKNLSTKVTDKTKLQRLYQNNKELLKFIGWSIGGYVWVRWVDLIWW